MAKIKLIANTESYSIYNGSMLDMLEVIEPNTIDSIITDPPYELNFMNKGWDRSGIAFQKETWKKCYEVLKPGGYLLAFGGSRTHHRIACAIEDAGFEIRDTIMWLYGSGFPKSLDISKAIDKKLGAKREVVGSKMSGIANKSEKNRHTIGASKAVKVDITLPSSDLAKKYAGYGTSLKPAYEPVIVARKPFKGTVVDNVINCGVGGLNIDECRVGEARGVKKINIKLNSGSKNSGFGCNGQLEESNDGRFPANVIHDGSKEVISGFPNTSGSVSRYFYCAKVSKKDRDEGLYDYRKNLHPTVKPCELMQYLIRLVTPKGGIILDPFMGSGSTGKACMFENRERNANYKFIGIDLEKEYCNIASVRIDYVLNKYKYDYQQELKKAKEKGQMSLF